MKKASKESIRILRKFSKWTDAFTVFPSGRFKVVYDENGPHRAKMAVEGFLADKFENTQSFRFRALRLGVYQAHTATLNTSPLAVKSKIISKMRLGSKYFSVATKTFKVVDRVTIGSGGDGKSKTSVKPIIVLGEPGKPHTAKQVRKDINFQPKIRTGDQSAFMIDAKVFRDIPKHDYDAYLTDDNILVLFPDGESFTIYVAVETPKS